MLTKIKNLKINFECFDDCTRNPILKYDNTIFLVICQWWILYIVDIVYSDVCYPFKKLIRAKIA